MTALKDLAQEIWNVEDPSLRDRFNALCKRERGDDAYAKDVPFALLEALDALATLGVTGVTLRVDPDPECLTVLLPYLNQLNEEGLGVQINIDRVPKINLSWA